MAHVTLVQKWGAIHCPKSLWDLKSEIGALHLSDFTTVKVISLQGHYVNIMFHYWLTSFSIIIYYGK
jgi:hypothetical protein